MALSGNSRFAYAPDDVDIRRSRIDRSCSYKTTANVGDLIPIYVDDVLPGDTFDMKSSKVIRLQTLLTPMMDNLYADFYWFFVPNRLVWDHWQEFMGENRDSAWIPAIDYSIPQVEAPSGGWSAGTLADYMGIPIGVDGLSISDLYFRGYAKIVDDWFRDENLQAPVNLQTGDSTLTGSNGSDYVTDLSKGGLPFVANKYHDVFTSALPSPQKGPDVDIDLGGYANVMVGSPRTTGLAIPDSSATVLTWYATQLDGASSFSGGKYQISSVYNNFGTGTVDTRDTFDGEADYKVVPSNLYADLSAISAFSINDLRLAFQIQKFYEKSARGGTRYIEILKSFFGVTSPDYRLQRPEYLGGNRVPLNINQVIQQSETTASSPLANTAAMSLTSDSHSDFVKSFTEHGMIFGLCCVRYDHTYQQGLNKMFSRKSRFDFYWPVFANLGEQPILNKEIYCDGSSTDDEVFGYQEAWYEYRYKPNIVTGEMRSSYATPLDSWHLADDYAACPQLSSSWIQEDPNNVDRVLAVTSANANQYFMDVYFKNLTTRPMPLYSVPGLIDHH